MKKILFASTALVATAGVASADIAFTGAANMGLKYMDGAVEELTLHREVTLTVAMTGETDGGLTFGADMTITAGGVGDTVVYIEGGFGKLAAGDVDNGIEAVTGLDDLGFDGIGTDNVAEVLRGGSSASLLYTGTFGDFTVAASAGLSTDSTKKHSDDWAIGAKYDMGNYNIALGYGAISSLNNDKAKEVVLGDSENAIFVQLGANVGDVALAAMYSKTTLDKTNTVAIDGAAPVVVGADLDVTAYGLTAGYTMGATTITAAYSKVEVGANAADAFGIGFGYDLGGGAKLKGAVGEFGGSTVADLGITMSF